jgi:hypothetical protein
MCRSSVRREDSTRLEDLFWFETDRKGIEAFPSSARHRAGVFLAATVAALLQQIENWVFFLFISLIRAGSPMFFGTERV